MRSLPGNFTMRRDGAPKQGDWFRIKNEADSSDVYIYDEIGFWGTTATDFVQEITKIDSGQINLHLNSPGGEIFDGLAIYNALKQHKANVTVYVDALAASAASFIAQAGDEIVMARNAQMMIHDGIGIAFGNEADMLETADLLGKLSNNIADIYSQRAGGTVEEWRALMKAEMWYSGSEAVDAGLADSVLDSENKDAEQATNKWDLTFFNYAGREHAESPLRMKERVLVTNRQKENDMGDKPKNNAEASTESGTAEPAGGTATGEADETGAEVQPEGQETVEVPAVEVSNPPTETSASNKATAAQGVLINGVMVTDWQAIQNHLASLETAQNEAQEQFRRDFVTGLSNANKIPATMVDGLTAHALSLSAEQFSEWSALYDAAPSQGLFAKHGSTGGSSDQQASSTNEAADRIEVLKGVVAMHERTMSAEKVKQTKSYIELQTLLGDENNS